MSFFLSPTMVDPEKGMQEPAQRPHLENIKFAIIDILTAEPGLLVECIAKDTFKPILWGPEETRLKALLSKVEEQCKTICNPTQAVLARALLAVDNKFQYQVSKKCLKGNEQVRANGYREDARHMYYAWSNLRRKITYHKKEQLLQQVQDRKGKRRCLEQKERDSPPKKRRTGEDVQRADDVGRKQIEQECGDAAKIAGEKNGGKKNDDATEHCEKTRRRRRT